MGIAARSPARSTPTSRSRTGHSSMATIRAVYALRLWGRLGARQHVDGAVSAPGQGIDERGRAAR